MKQLIGRMLMSFVGIAGLLLPGVAQAQSTLPVIKVDVPFEFTVGKTTLPAGQYSLVEPVQHYIQLRDARGRFVASMLTNGVESSTAPEASVLRFYVSGGRHVLAEVWEEGNQLGEQLPQAKSTDVTVAEEASAAQNGAAADRR